MPIVKANSVDNKGKTQKSLFSFFSKVPGGGKWS
jgi:hypothetical protein